MAQQTEAKALTDRILAGITVENIKETAFFFSKLKRVTASPDAESASAYICSKLSEYGIPHEQLWYSGYLSSAVSAKLEIIFPEQQEFEVVPCGYTKNVTDLEGELIYDRWGECARLSVNDNAERFRSFAGKVVFTQCFCRLVCIHPQKRFRTILVHLTTMERQRPKTLTFCRRSPASTVQKRQAKG